MHVKIKKEVNGCANLVIPQITLGNNHKKVIFDKLIKLNKSPYINFEYYSLELMKVYAYLPVSLMKEIERFKNVFSHPGALLLKNLPNDLALPLTPRDDRRCQSKSTFVSEGMLILISRMLGNIFSYDAEKSGELIHNIVPIKEKSLERSNGGSSEDFLFHTELAYFKHRPDFILLYCLKRNSNNNSGYTTLAFAKKAISKLTEAEINILRQPIFEIGISESFGLKLRRLNKVLHGPIEFPQICINFNNMRCQNSEGKEALNKLKHYLELEDNFQKISLKPGELLLIDNRKTVHGRTPFEAKYDGHDRWLQRIYVKSNLWDARHLTKTNSRVLCLN